MRVNAPDRGGVYRDRMASSGAPLRAGETRTAAKAILRGFGT